MNLLSIERNSIRLNGHAHGMVTKTVHKTLPGGGWVWGLGVIDGVSRCHSIDRLPKLWLLHLFQCIQIKKVTDKPVLFVQILDQEVAGGKFPHINKKVYNHLLWNVSLKN